jgi:murein DD-endopeptidase MepM/ murein hydrolase activator NlpD
MQRLTIFLGIFFVQAIFSTAFAMEIRVHPDAVIPYRETPTRDFYSLMVHNMVFINDSEQTINVEEITIEAIVNGNTNNTVTIGSDHIQKTAEKMNRYQKAGVFETYDFYFQTSKILPKGTTLSDSRSLDGGEALLISQTPMLVRGAPELLRVTVNYSGASGNGTAIKDVKVTKYQTENEYIFPVSGVWYNAAGASLRTHHRWVANEEFALDLVLIGPNQRSRLGDANVPEDYYAYGQNVLSIGAGTVVAVEAGMKETYAAFQKDGESTDEFEARTAKLQDQFMEQGIYAVLGNYLSIKHAGGEFSHYAHLADGSVSLAIGDTVTQGQIIGKVGQTGNSTEPHLHFQLTDAGDPLYAQGLPIIFTNATELFDRTTNISPGSGWMIETSGQEPAP